MSNGQLHTGKKHSTSSKRLFHYGDLNNKAKTSAKKSWRK
jgi:hypothetical protein